VGDFGLALGLFATYLLFETIEFSGIFEKVKEFKAEEFVILGCHFNSITFICVALFIGAMGKSAQLGLHTWLPDAMEGPTPVSALIHAATMVTAGIFLVARFSPMYEYSELARNMVTIVGATTAIFAATIALTQNDIKKIIAYSTCSQLGYMFFACGVSAYAAGIFHLYTHGFFKALLFLSAGSVIHAMSDEQDIKKMGALWNKIPLTYVVMLIGTLAITGFPYLSGYFSKDLILEAAYAKSQAGSGVAKYAFYVGIVTAFLTAFYSWRLVLLTFHGKFRNTDEVKEHIHESPVVMTLPLMLLSIGALFVGYIFANKLGIGHEGLKFWSGALKEGFAKYHGERESIYTLAHHVPDFVKQLPLIVGAMGFILALIMYIIAPKLPDILVHIFRPLYLLSYNKWYIDEIYNFVLVRPIMAIGRFFWKIVDTKIVDGIPNGFAAISESFGRRFKALQSGYIYHYSSIMLIGIISVLGYLIYIWGI
ncbi:MAG TPA: NADH-quinone oxidoreductase subunit L, partial [Alphaproteobacteria bacterium]|nr:NADH-quinone oxidoreductase subunit L [Alphaproteobacteria bacterium]